MSVDLIYGSRVTSWLSILEYRSHRWTGRGLIYRQTALLRLVSSLIVSSEFVLERLHYRHSIDDKVSIKLGILFVQCDFISTRLTCSIIFYVFYGSRRESIDRSPSNFVNFLRKGIQKRLKKKKNWKIPKRRIWKWNVNSITFHRKVWMLKMKKACEKRELIASSSMRMAVAVSRSCRNSHVVEVELQSLRSLEILRGKFVGG